MNLGSRGLVGKTLSPNIFPQKENLWRKPSMLQRKIRNLKRKRARRIRQLHHHPGQ
jgi:hypothetical protein